MDTRDLNCNFFDEFNELDNLCRDMYGQSADKKLGVTLYLEDMDKNTYQGSFRISEWETDYKKLKRMRNIRNELAHGKSSFYSDLCTQEDVDFLRSFRSRILNRSDPLAELHREMKRQREASYTPPSRVERQNVHRSARGGCFGAVAMFILLAAAVIAFIFL